MDISIREMTIEDIDNVHDIAMESWHATYEGIIPRQLQDNFLGRAYSYDMLSKRMRNSNLFIAVVEGEIVGFADFSMVDEDGVSELVAIYLSPDKQGKGIGSALVQNGIDKLGDVKEILVEVEKGNAIGRRFYEARGFKIVKEYDDNFDGHILNTIQMVLKL